TGGTDCLSRSIRCGGFGGVSRAAKGADCKSAGYAFVGSSPTSPTTLKNYLFWNLAERKRPLSVALLSPRAVGDCMRHTRDMNIEHALLRADLSAIAGRRYGPPFW